MNMYMLTSPGLIDVIGHCQMVASNIGGIRLRAISGPWRAAVTRAAALASDGGCRRAQAIASARCRGGGPEPGTTASCARTGGTASNTKSGTRARMVERLPVDAH